MDDRQQADSAQKKASIYACFSVAALMVLNM
jgi:hypothetical protein